MVTYSDNVSKHIYVALDAELLFYLTKFKSCFSNVVENKMSIAWQQESKFIFCLQKSKCF